ncbi:unnamed protein product [Lupinus luteus]|uniref:S-protein homolog n=1 Tax=Lupinus luteus TaxID=3873 RepID=A0AAV1VZL1_LUPLU
MMMVISSRHILFSSLILLAPLLVMAVEYQWPPLTYRHVYVKNNLDNHTILTLHCKDKDHDLGVQKLNYQEEFKFQFKPNFLGNRLYFCGLTWDGNLHWFVVYNDRRDLNFCKDLHWSINKDKPCLFNCDTQKYDCDYNYN